MAASKPAIKGISIVNVKGKKLTLKKGAVFALKVKVKAKAGTKKKYKKVSFISSDKKIISVSSKGKIKAKKTGTAKVTVRSKTDKKKKTVLRITVKGKEETAPTAPAAPTETPNDTETPTAVPTEKPDVTPTGVPVITSKPDGTSTLCYKPYTSMAYVGNKLSESVVEGGHIVDSNGAEIPGKYEWENPDTVLEKAGKTFYKVNFQPADRTFEKISGIRIPVQVSKRQLFLKPPKASAITTDQALSHSSLTGGSASDASGKAVNGHFEWLDETAVILREDGRTQMPMEETGRAMYII